MNKEDGISYIAYFRTDGGSCKLYTEEYVDNLEKENKQLKEDKKKAREYLKNMEDFSKDEYDDLLEILRDKEIEEIPQFKGTLEQLDNLTILGDKE